MLTFHEVINHMQEVEEEVIDEHRSLLEVNTHFPFTKSFVYLLSYTIYSQQYMPQLCHKRIVKYKVFMEVSIFNLVLIINEQVSFFTDSFLMERYINDLGTKKGLPAGYFTKEDQV